jgi:hypothetical protein
MCKLSDALKLCTCDAASIDELDHFWVFHRFDPTKNELVIGRILIPYALAPEIEAHNRALLLARLDDPDAFDVDLAPRDGDRLQLTFRFGGHYEQTHYGYERRAGKWVEQAYDGLSWSHHHDREHFGEVRPVETSRIGPYR